MNLPDYWLKRPGGAFDEAAENAFDELLQTTLAIEGCPTIDYTLPWPKWQFLCHVADHHAIALHGSGDPNIALFEPRQSNDLNDFGNQKAIYAASDGLWAMFFAIVDRDRVTSITNACVRLEDETGAVHGPLYVFSVSQSALAKSTLAHRHSLPPAALNLHHSAAYGIWHQQSPYRSTGKFRSGSTSRETHNYT